MLTAGLVQVRRQGDRLLLRNLDGPRRSLARELAEQYLDLAAAHVGRSREELNAALDAVGAPATEKRLADGLRKLVLDRGTFELPEGPPPRELRQALFERASALRRALPPGLPFDREAVLAEVAPHLALTPAELEARLFADLPGAQRLTALDPTTPDQLLAAYQLGQRQAVLLRAIRVTLEVAAAQATTYRGLFRRLKFLRLLHTIQSLPSPTRPSPEAPPAPPGYRILIDGPLSLFGPVTKYGLQLALLLPTLEDCDRWTLEAEVRWGKERRPLRFQLAGGAPVPATPAPARLPDELNRLVEQFTALGRPWDVAPAQEILELPGVGLCLPDLRFTRQADGTPVYLELLGYWSRDAVWRRVDLVRAGLPYRILFAASSRLRVSEAALDDRDLPAALHVFKGTLNARRIADQLEELAGRD